MTKNNIYLPKENIPKTEEVREMDNKYEIPSFEEFMKTYEESNLNYDDLRGGDIGTPKGYGPVIDPELKAEGRKAREKEEELNKK